MSDQILATTIYGYSLNFNQSGGKYGDGLLTGFWQDRIPFSLDYVDVEPDNLTHQHVVLHEVIPVTADAGGPYFLDQTPITLAGSAEGDFGAVAWDLDGDSLFDDALGLNPSISSTMLTSLGFSPGMTLDIGLQVKGLYGGVDVSMTQLTFIPVPSAVLLGSIGLSVAGWRLRKRRER